MKLNVKRTFLVGLPFCLLACFGKFTTLQCPYSGHQYGLINFGLVSF